MLLPMLLTRWSRDPSFLLPPILGPLRLRIDTESDDDERARKELAMLRKPVWHATDQGRSQEAHTQGPNLLTYHAVAKLASNQPALLIDPGSVQNLCGDKWAKEVARRAKRNGRTPSFDRRKKPLEVNGVGQGSQHCHYDVNLPIGFRDTREQQVEAGVKSATVTNSDLPGLLGLQSLEKMGAVLDLRTGTLTNVAQTTGH